MNKVCFNLTAVLQVCHEYQVLVGQVVFERLTPKDRAKNYLTPKEIFFNFLICITKILCFGN